MITEKGTENFQDETIKLQGESIIFVTPFYNEELNIPDFFSNAQVAAKDKSIFFLGVNHRSKDNSKTAFKSSSESVGRSGVLYESTDVPSVGIPRQRGLLRGIELARNEKSAGRKVIVGSIDIDSKIPPNYFNEAQDFAETESDFLIFPTRYEPDTLLACADLQVDENARIAALRDLIGIDWMKFNLRSFLIRSGAIETRGSGGYFFTVDGYDKAGGHKPLYSSDGKLIVGESNALGIRATRAHALYTDSATVVTANPRRMLQSVLKSSEEYKILTEGKTFAATANVDKLPILSTEGWNRHFATALNGALRTFAIKGLAYGVIDNLREMINNSELFNSFVDRMKAKYDQKEFGGDEREAIGSAIYIGIYNEVIAEMGMNADVLLGNFAQAIPDTEQLIAWGNTKENLKPIEKLSL